MCEYCETKSMIGIDEPLLDALIVASGLTADDIKKLNLQKKIAKPVKPTFKPNPNLGEGVSSKENIDYRQELLNLLKNVYNQSSKILKYNKSPDEKIKELDTIIDDYISEGSNLIKTQITTAYMDGVKYATDKLMKLGAKKPKVDKNPERLQSLIRQQQMNLEDAALVLRGRLRQLVNISDVMGYYDNKNK